MLPQTLATPALLFLVFIFILSAAVLFHPKQHQHDGKHPPGPKAYPIIGNLHMLGKLPHRTLQALATKYGPIMSLKLGQVPTIVVSSPEAAELFLKTHDTVFASRPKIQASEYMFYGGKGLGLAQYGAYWRSMRKLCTLQLLSASKVEMFAPLRREELGQLLQSLKKAAAASCEVVDLSEMVGELIANITYKMVLGCNNDSSLDLKGLIREAMNLAGAFNLADFLPWLSIFDPQGLASRMKKTSKAFDQMVEQIVKDHEHPSDNKKKDPHGQDFIDVLLSLMHQSMDPHDEKEHVIDKTNIKAIVLDMIGGALDSSATTIEWAMSALLRHPRVMKSLQNELENVVGMDRHVEETDLENLPYLNMVVKETLRLYPAGPLLAPRECLKDVTIDGYHIKEKSRIIINAWAIGRDQRVWSNNCDMFYPERFVNSNVDLRGHDFQFIPFGSGRRGCPGMNLGLNTIRLVVAQLVHCFNWELPFNMSPDELDMSERFGLSMPRTNHLLAIPTCRLADI